MDGVLQLSRGIAESTTHQRKRTRDRDRERKMATELPLKVFVKKGGKLSSIRRLCLIPPTFERVKEIVGRWVPRTAVIQYHDDEGDLVTMSSEPEWEECVRQWELSGESTLKIEVEKEDKRKDDEERKEEKKAKKEKK
eukprot:Sspe_Gene.100725::Locus_75389_Transcript_1_1_Confidence_1.000_Length_581::g.100725::m.100725